MTIKNIAVIEDKNLSDRYNKRYVVVDKETGKVFRVMDIRVSKTLIKHMATKIVIRARMQRNLQEKIT